MANTITSQIPFYVPPPDGSPGYFHIDQDATTGERVKNYTLDSRDLSIENIRGKEDSVTLDTAGFQFYTRPATHKSFQNDEEIEKEYYPESIALLKELTGASRVVLFDHTVRRRRPGQLDDSPQKRQPVGGAHVDQTPKSAEARVHKHLPAEDVPELLKHRYQLINLWRPINHTAEDWPLALCDFRSVDPKSDVVPVALIYPHREPGETYWVKYNAQQKWKYLKDMTPEELVLIKCFDSVQDGSVALFTPHTAFPDPTTRPDAPHRESIELRALVFYDN